MKTFLSFIVTIAFVWLSALANWSGNLQLAPAANLTAAIFGIICLICFISDIKSLGKGEPS